MNDVTGSLSTEQQAIVDAVLGPMSVLACAGSGKTCTAVHRLASIRKRIGEHRGYVALLSFSNIAVTTFNTSYAELTKGMSSITAAHRIRIETFDSFLTTNILRPHACRTMGCPRTPYLITGSETFLQNTQFQFWAVPAVGKAFPVPRDEIESVVVRLNNQGAATFHYQRHKSLLPIHNGPTVVARLGALGAYTHGLGQYWAYQTLIDQPAILRALARRYPHIVVDEAQDVVSVHQALLELLVTAGVQVTLVGDPSQAIYEFAGADGSYLREHATKFGVASHALTKNYRSVPLILATANALSKQHDIAHRSAPDNDHGAFFVGYREAQLDQLVDAFQTTLISAGLKTEKSAVVCRARGLANQLAGVDVAVGQGIVKGLASAAVLRDRRGDYYAAFKNVAACVVALLADPPGSLLVQVAQPARYPEWRPLTREIWAFTRDAAFGLPASTLVADAVWQPALLARIKDLLARIDAKLGLAPATNIGKKLSKRALPNAPLITSADLAGAQDTCIRIDTVHQVKGESLDAVLYIAKKSHVQALIAGVDTEVGRIGYVAVTRAKDLFWLGVPASALAELRGPLIALGFKERGVPDKTPLAASGPDNLIQADGHWPDTP